ncbi:extracellular solute-binding protein [Streptomyces californicus]
MLEGGVASGFEKKKPGIKVNITGRWKRASTARSPRSRPARLPDIAQIGAYADYAKAGKLYSADEEALAIRTTANPSPSYAEAGKIDGTPYGLPFVASTRLASTRSSSARQAWTPPQTWADVSADAAALKAKGVAYPFALPLARRRTRPTLMWLLSGGGGYTDDVGAYDIDWPGERRHVPLDAGQPRRQGPHRAGRAGQAGPRAGVQGVHRRQHGAERAAPAPDGRGRGQGDRSMPAWCRCSEPSRGLHGRAADWMMGFKQNGNRQAIGKFFDFAYSDENVLEFAEEYDLLPVTGSADLRLRWRPTPSTRSCGPPGGPANSTLTPYGKTSWATVSETIKKKIGSAVAPGERARDDIHRGRPRRRPPE